ncbi:MAG TPA: VOC family protein [Dehalococcoidia bacterium]|jgi:catechol 2,3-dioxygenase-like lactoylglutathione lyase family enzyme
MLVDAIDHVILPVRDARAAVEPFARLGLTLFPGTRHQDAGTENAGFFVGTGASGFYVEALGIADRAAAQRTHGDAFLAAADAGRGLSGVVLRTGDLGAAVARLQSHGVECRVREVRGEDGTKICDVAEAHGPHADPVGLRLIQYFPSHAERWARREATGLTTHAFPLKRLDHLAVIAPDLESETRFWRDVMDVPLAGEIASPALIIRQMGIGDAMLELLGPASPDSPMASRPPGLVSVIAFEVQNLDAALTEAQRRGFHPSPAEPGVLPRTRRAAIPPDQFSGITLQLLQYV